MAFSSRTYPIATDWLGVTAVANNFGTENYTLVSYGRAYFDRFEWWGLLTATGAGSGTDTINFQATGGSLASFVGGTLKNICDPTNIEFSYGQGLLLDASTGTQIILQVSGLTECIGMAFGYFSGQSSSLTYVHPGDPISTWGTGDRISFFAAYNLAGVNL